MKRNSSRTHRRNKPLVVVNPHAAGIDLGATQHFVCCPVAPDAAEIRSFGTDTPSLAELVDWLAANGVDSVAMESTGVYWIPLYEMLADRGFAVSLADPRSVSSLPGRKSDVADCQWLQQLHSYGLVRGSFRPSEGIVRFRALVRMKLVLVEDRSDWVRRMQKEMDEMNVRVHRAVRDVTGLTGLAMVRAIVAGERDPERLADLRDGRCRKSREEMVRELTGTWREEHLLNLGTCLRMFDDITARIEDVEEAIRELAERYTVDDAPSAPPHPNPRKAARMRREGQEPKRELLFRMTGVDLTTIDAVAVETAETVIAELGTDFGTFPDHKHFLAYLRLAPTVAVSGGKVLRNKSRGVGVQRTRTALILAAATIRASKTGLGAYYRSIAYRKGNGVAAFATARKIATHIFNLVKFGAEYVSEDLHAYDERHRDRRVARLKANAKDLGFQLLPAPAPATA
jgi:transposase